MLQQSSFGASLAILALFLIDSSLSIRTITYVDIDGVHNRDDHKYSLINNHHLNKRDVDQPAPPKSSSIFEEFTRVLNSTDPPEFPTELTEEQKKLTKNNTQTDNHTYYNITYLYEPAITNSYWINMKDIKESVRHEMLSNAHRRAATIRLSFKFPFYGHKIENVTIATGGFLFLGDAVHTWLAATQYIAPLMANFNTSINSDSSIYYYDNKTSFTVQWDNVYLQEVTVNSSQNDTNGKPIRNVIEKPFSFQATLKDSGDIIFVYKQIPFEISKINEEKHPVKVGISDAYIIDRTIFFIRRKTIYEYHKAELKSKQITNNTVIYFKAILTCNSLTDCQTCTTKLNATFDCQWCEATKKCSDGYDRHRQEWLKNKCDDNAHSSTSKCTLSDQTAKEEHSGTGSDSSSIFNQGVKPLIPVNNNDISNSNPSSTNQEKLKSKTINGKEQNKQSRKGSFAFMFILMCLVVMIGYWGMYAYMNPQSKPGQFLIKYRRPSQWRFNNNNSESG